jgi:SAM-dependent methyltransferase
MQSRNLLKNIISLFKHKIDVDSRKIQAFVREASAEIADNSSVLDAGAGECQYRQFFFNKYYIAVDSGLGDINWDYSHLDLVCNLEKLPFKPNVYEAVICTQVLEHVKEPETVLKEILRVLKPNGILYLSAPQGWGVHQPPNDFFRFTRYGLQYLMEKAGFTILSIQPVGGFYNYLANRLTVLPKTIFWQIEKKILRIILFPMEILFYLFFVLLIPFVLNRFDFLDKKQDYTLNYLVKVQKPENFY